MSEEWPDEPVRVLGMIALRALINHDMDMIRVGRESTVLNYSCGEKRVYLHITDILKMDGTTFIIEWSVGNTGDYFRSKSYPEAKAMLDEIIIEAKCYLEE